MRHILETNPYRYTSVFGAISGMVAVFNWADRANWGEDAPLWVVLGFIAVLGSLTGIFLLTAAAQVVTFVGRLMEGQGERDAIRCALAWALLPHGFVLILRLIQLAIFGDLVFDLIWTRDSSWLWSSTALFWINSMVNLWVAGIAVVTVSVAHRFALSRSIATFLLLAVVGWGIGSLFVFVLAGRA